MGFGNPDRSPVGINRSDAAPTPPGFLKIVRHYLEWFIRSEEILVVIYRFTSALPGRCAGNSLLPFPYNEVTDESPPTGAAKYRVPGYTDKN